jgi:hypothetical protein
MKRMSFIILFLAATFSARGLFAEQVKDLLKKYPVVSVPYTLPDNDQQNFADVYFRFGWSSKPPYTIAVQFANHAYKTRKLKFAIKDVTTNKTVLLDAVHNVRFGTETLKANSTSAIWSGPVDNINDSFSLRVWSGDGDEFDKEPISIKDQQ